MRVKAVVAEVRNEATGVYVIAKSRKIKGAIWVTPKGWQEAEVPKVQDEIVVWNLRKSDNGWKALGSMLLAEKTPAL